MIVSKNCNWSPWVKFALVLGVACCLTPGSTWSQGKVPTLEEADTRVRRAFAFARETNDKDKVDQIISIRDRLKSAVDRRDEAAIERLIQEAEKAVGIDPGGKTMFGLPISQLTSLNLRDWSKGEPEALNAFASEDPKEIAATITKMNKLLGEQVGVPDLRRKGDTGKVERATSKDVVEVFLAILDRDRANVQAMSKGTVSQGTMARHYATIVDGCLAIRPHVEKHQPKRLETIDDLIGGCCKIMIALQLESGSFKFPDLREKSIRFGEMTEKLIQKNPDAVVDGWLVIESPDGGSQFDAGECGVALLNAAKQMGNETWKKAGLKAANWALGQKVVPNFNYNAFSVSLLATAYLHTKEDRFRVGAIKKYQLGVAPGQAPNGRWLDFHNARTVYHMILLRCLNDLIQIVDDEKLKPSIITQRDLAVATIIEEAEKLGAPVTTLSVQVLKQTLATKPASSKAVQHWLDQSAALSFQKCNPKGKIRPAISMAELGAIAQAWAD